MIGIARLMPLLALPAAAVTLLVVGIGAGAADQAAQSCNIPDLYAASDAQLQACGLKKVPLSGTAALPGGGVAYNYTLPDGQVYTMNEPPSGFDPVTASASEDAAYGLPPAPPLSSPGYAAWRTMADGSWASPGAKPYIVVADAPLTQPSSNAGASTTTVSSSH